jgi:hypothetical protein
MMKIEQRYVATCRGLMGRMEIGLGDTYTEAATDCMNKLIQQEFEAKDFERQYAQEQAMTAQSLANDIDYQEQEA